jgi:hypothetical protein
MPYKMDWIPDPDTWNNVANSNTKDFDICRLNDVVKEATGEHLSHGQDIVLEKKHLPYFEGARAGGLAIASSVLRGIKEHGRIRLRFRKL